ncbi:MAG: CRISPR-associated endonuclease Cas2 [Rhodocyclaceae bacterium]|nr:CRISPR-associated endonuclease Cas2 [Rhodocyclaceae bacterium]
MRNEHLYIVIYDISDIKRWRQVFRLMKGFGAWLQLSAFQCRLDPVRHAELIALLDGAIKEAEDHVVLIDLGPADQVAPKVVSLGRSVELLRREPKVL